jgi:excisionase family DNA binding protein
MEQVNGDRLLKVSEVARMFRVDSNTVRRWIKCGALDAHELPGNGPNKKYRVDREEVDRVLNPD